jgi:NADH dehydrogenase
VFGLSLTGLPAWLMWRAYYLSQMPTFGRKLRIFVEWTWGMFFPADITHFRFSKSKEL